MIEWKYKFEQNTLERGMTFYTSNRVVDLNKSGDTYTAAVLGIKRFEVKMKIINGFPSYMKCSCPISRGGGNCEHMAAVLYAIETEELNAEKQREKISADSHDMSGQMTISQFMNEASEEKTLQDSEEESIQQYPVLVSEDDLSEYTLLGDSWEDYSDEHDAGTSDDGRESIASIERYNYFDGTAIRKSMDIPKLAYVEGEKLFNNGRIEITEIESGYDRKSGKVMGKLSAIGRSGQDKFSVNLLFLRSEVVNFECRCPKCRKGYYMWFSNRTNCPYKAGVLLQLEKYLCAHSIGDSTDLNAQKLFNYYKEKRANMAADTIGTEGSLKLIPRVIKKEGKLSISFKIGEKKVFVIKNLEIFCKNVKESAIDTYGSSTQISHNIENFTEKGKDWIHFIERMVREELEFRQRFIDMRGYYSYQNSGIGGELNLFGWRLDELYERLPGEAVEFENRDGRQIKRGTLTCANRNPKVTMRISAEELENDEFHGIVADGCIPDMYMGTDMAYYIDNNCLCRVEGEFMRRIEPLSNLSYGNTFSFHVGRNHMTEFYHRILPGLADTVDIIETEPEKFRKYLLPDAHFVFYLDAQTRNVTCKVHARYGEKEVSVLDILDLDNEDNLEAFRDVTREKEVLVQIMQWFPEADLYEEELHCGRDEELIYRIMESGTEKLMEIGEVRCTKRFMGYHTLKPVKVSVGVSVSSGLLELNVSTGDIPQSEMMDILNSYRARKKYYRLKDGSFVNLNDTSLEMLAELMDSMHLKPKEFVKGKMHLPMYRTLYLDKMLEENDSIYINRDSHFREVVKNFKTVKDADFEEPKSLSSVMRNYQKNGYKWLRTLEAWQFGGILADDMGLGKTLQVIAVLLAAKREGMRETSLVVSPASLVYNWGEEFRKFAPELNISLITGTQDERQLKIEAYRESDVVVTSYDLLKRDIAYYEDKQFAYEIIDEAQYIKNHTTEAAKAVKIVKSRIRYALTGTPIENRLSELWSIFDYLMPGFLYSYEVFKREMESPIVKNGDEAAMKRLQKMVGPFILRRLKEDVLKDLPMKLEENRFVKLGSTQQKLYDAQVLHMRESLASQNDDEFNKNKILILAELMKLRQICCDPSLCFDNYDGGAAKLEACVELIQSAIDGGHRMLVFSQFTSMLEILQKSLDESGIAYYTITGSTSKEKRLQLVKEFNDGDTPVFLISLKAGGVGLNLIGADTVIHYDPWWNIAVQNQATDRAHRIGQTKKVMVYKLIVKNSIEEKILNLQETKRNLAEQIISSDSGQLSGLSREEIMALLDV